MRQKIRLGHTQHKHLFLGEQELVEFLTEEILAERKAQKVKTIPSELDGFVASLNGAEVTLTKKTDDEKYSIQNLLQFKYT